MPAAVVHIVQREDDVAIAVGTLGDSVLEKRLSPLEVCFLHPFCVLLEEAITLGYQFRGETMVNEMAFSFVVQSILLTLGIKWGQPCGRRVPPEGDTWSPGRDFMKSSLRSATEP
jgi:hypothetical protein